MTDFETPSVWGELLGTTDAAATASEDSQSLATVDTAEAAEITAGQSDQPVTDTDTVVATDNATDEATKGEAITPPPMERFQEVTTQNRELKEQLKAFEALKAQAAEKGFDLDSLPSLLDNQHAAAQEASHATLDQQAAQAASTEFYNIHGPMVQKQIADAIDQGFIDEADAATAFDARINELYQTPEGLAQFQGLKGLQLSQIQARQADATATFAEADKVAEAITLDPNFETVPPMMLAQGVQAGIKPEGLKQLAQLIADHNSPLKAELDKLRTENAELPNKIQEAVAATRREILDQLARGESLAPTEGRSNGALPTTTTAYEGVW